MDADRLEQIVSVHQTDYDSIGGCECGESYPCTTRSLVNEVRRLQYGIRASCEWWDGTRPDAPAFEVTNDFRRLLRGSPDGR